MPPILYHSAIFGCCLPLLLLLLLCVDAVINFALVAIEINEAIKILQIKKFNENKKIKEKKLLDE